MKGLLVNIDVDDLTEAARFYTEALGLTAGRRFGAAGVELLGAPAPIYLLAKPAGSPAFAGVKPAARDYHRHWTPVHLDIEVEDLDLAVSRAVSAGARLESGVDRRAWGRIATLSDPFGHGFCLLEFEGSGYDAVADPTAP